MPVWRFRRCPSALRSPLCSASTHNPKSDGSRHDILSASDRLSLQVQRSTINPKVPHGVILMTQYPWQRRYENVLREVTPSKMEERIVAAENAIHDRLEDSLHGRHPLDSSERNAIHVALSHLRHLKKKIA
jgi:hypothetical protein